MVIRSLPVIPAQAAIQWLQVLTGSRLRGSDGSYAFFDALDPGRRSLTRGAGCPGTRGQALLELLVVLPVLLLLLLAAVDLGRLFVISGKSEIAARYIALSHFRDAPFGDAYPGMDPAVEIEGIFFDDALDDHSGDDQDVTFTELGDEDFLYGPGQAWPAFLTALWDAAMGGAMVDLAPVRGARSTFAYDLPALPSGSVLPWKGTLPLTGGTSGLAASYDVSGNFVMLADSFSGASGDRVRGWLTLRNYIAGADLAGIVWLSYVAFLLAVISPL